MKKYEKDKILKEYEYKQKKEIIINEYFNKFKWWFLIVLLSVALSVVWKFIDTNIFQELTFIFRLSILIMWGVSLFYLINMCGKTGGGLLQISSLMFVVGSIVNFYCPILGFGIAFICASLFNVIVMKILVGQDLRLIIKAKDLPWFDEVDIK